MRISDWSSDVCSSDLEQPDDIDEMPIPGSRFETEMLLGGEVAIVKALQADREDDGADDDVKAMKSGRHEKGRAVNGALEGERRMIIFKRLARAEHQAKPDRAPPAFLCALAFTVDPHLLRPGAGSPRPQTAQRHQPQTHKRHY